MSLEIAVGSTLCTYFILFRTVWVFEAYMLLLAEKGLFLRPILNDQKQSYVHFFTTWEEVGSSTEKSLMQPENMQTPPS